MELLPVSLGDERFVPLLEVLEISHRFVLRVSGV